ncbi:NAD-dependent epimerase/dehydratase family protein [Aliihoeflea aestuarii]|jgi:nucleoside-diphosphate-sugar epimerase|uniref:NAD-dependent epimerase/dehydratase family protein n=1 Tax=Aliihoeflea aestuarii TaxID=453840 RepID=UPI00209226B3|nr:NAD(P)-dependent oxidoreductase [Aliihoeflea aestuarii]MCO6391244.1 NAD-dependent epimerase/dehydratase family protein [Aliihoeflea aestuarii]
MNVLITGGTGYVGRFLVERLLADGDAVTVFGRNAPAHGFFSRTVQFVAGDLEPANFAPDWLAGFDAVIHAAFDHVPGKYRDGEGDDADGFVRRNRDAGIALFEAAKQARVPRVVFLSTRAVYGPKAPGKILTEETPAEPDTLYGRVKLEAENALAALADEHFTPVSLRVTGVYGPAGPGRAHKWAGLLADHIAGKPTPPRAGTEVHGADVAAAVRIALDHAKPPPVLNVSDLLVDQRDLLAIVDEITGVKRLLPERADTSGINAMDCTPLKSFGWKPGGEALLRATVKKLLL